MNDTGYIPLETYVWLIYRVDGCICKRLCYGVVHLMRTIQEEVADDTIAYSEIIKLF